MLSSLRTRALQAQAGLGAAGARHPGPGSMRGSGGRDCHNGLVARLETAPPVRRRWQGMLAVGVAMSVLAGHVGARALALTVTGGPAPLSARGDCLRDSARGGAAVQDCAVAVSALEAPSALLVDAHGADVYVASRDSDSVLALQRQRVGGALSPFPSPSPQACVQAPGGKPCGQHAPGLRGPDAMTLSSDGRQLYVGSLDGAAVTTLRRQSNGRLLAPRTHDGCLQGHALSGSPRDDCGRHAEGLFGVTGLAASSDGRNVYAVSTGVDSPGDSILALTRNRRDGTLDALRGPGGCVQSPGPARCARQAPGLRGPRAVIVTSDGRYVYVASALSSSVTAFARDRRTGRLRALTGRGGCVVDGVSREPPESACVSTAGGLGSARALALSPDGRELYVTSFDPGAITELTRDPVSGRLGARPGSRSCLQALADATCRTEAPALRGATGLALSRGGAFLYVTALGSNELVTVARDRRHGDLSVVRTPTLSDAVVNGPGAVALSPDGGYLYLASPFDDEVQALAVPSAQGARATRSARRSP